MSCDYCEQRINMMRAADAGFGVEKICIENSAYSSKGRLVGNEFRIKVELPDSYAMTLPIRFCPMCGEQLQHNPPDSLISIKDDMTLGACTYARKREIGYGGNTSDEKADCSHCEWASFDNGCGWLMRNDLADRLGKLINEEDKR